MFCAGAHLAVLRQDHGLRVAEVLLGLLQGAVGLAGAAAQRYGAQGVGGGGALHALHGVEMLHSGGGKTDTDTDE